MKSIIGWLLLLLRDTRIFGILLISKICEAKVKALYDENFQIFCKKKHCTQAQGVKDRII